MFYTESAQQGNKPSLDVAFVKQNLSFYLDISNDDCALQPPLSLFRVLLFLLQFYYIPISFCSVPIK